MGDEGFNACMYLWRNKLDVQRLLSILRESQDSCTDIECFNFSRLPASHDNQTTSNFIITCLIIGFALLMYAIRPQSLRNVRSGDPKSRNDEFDSNDGPSAPPPTAS